MFSEKLQNGSGPWPSRWIQLPSDSKRAPIFFLRLRLQTS
jgi:hypothetical protein